jgi:hypothetical protein
MFYQRHGFIGAPSQPRTLILSLADVPSAPDVV